jgi:hypothetical protein
MALAEKCKVFYDWRRLGKELSNNLEKRVNDCRLKPAACPSQETGLQGWLTPAHCSEEQ